MRGRPAAWATAFALAAASLASAPARAEDYIHNRFDYEEFRAGRSELLEPNYLPFMAARVEAPAGLARRWARRLGLVEPTPDLLVFCRWPDSAFPLRVAVPAPELPDALQDEIDPTAPEEYVAAVERALDRWQEALEGRVSFTRVAAEAEAVLRIDLVGAPAPAPEPGVQVLGTTRLRDACQIGKGRARDGRLDVRFHVPELRIFVADRHGLLLPGQVERIALHELGHALGMAGHSPIPADLMFRIARDRLPRGELGTEDVNSFVSLYSIPNGTVYADVGARGGAQASAGPPPGPARLGIAPHVDPRLGFEVQLPEGWTRVAMEQGVVAVDGVTWDYDASLQVLVRGHPTIDAYLERYAAGHLRGGRLEDQRSLRVAGQPAVRFALLRESTGFFEELTVLETGDGRVVVVIAECPEGLRDRYRPWFEAALATLELTGRADTDREYRPERRAGPSRGPRP